MHSPGPFSRPFRRPSLNITARLYSGIMRMQKKSESGNVASSSNHERKTNICRTHDARPRSLSVKEVVGVRNSYLTPFLKVISEKHLPKLVLSSCTDVNANSGSRCSPFIYRCKCVRL